MPSRPGVRVREGREGAGLEPAVGREVDEAPARGKAASVGLLVARQPDDGVGQVVGQALVVEQSPLLAGEDELLGARSHGDVLDEEERGGSHLGDPREEIGRQGVVDVAGGDRHRYAEEPAGIADGASPYEGLFVDPSAAALVGESLAPSMLKTGRRVLPKKARSWRRGGSRCVKTGNDHAAYRGESRPGGPGAAGARRLRP